MDDEEVSASRCGAENCAEMAVVLVANSTHKRPLRGHCALAHTVNQVVVIC